MLRVFIDTSVLFAAVYSQSGYAHDLITLALNEKVTVILSKTILNEVERNLRKKAPQRLAPYRTLLLLLDAETSEPSSDIFESVSDYVVAKDVHVVAAAIAAQPDYLVTYDRKHLLDVPEVALRSGLKIITPDIVVAELRANE